MDKSDELYLLVCIREGILDAVQAYPSERAMRQGLPRFLDEHVKYFDESDQLNGVVLDKVSGRTLDWFAFHQQAERLCRRARGRR